MAEWGRSPDARCTKLGAVPARVSSSRFVGRRTELTRLIEGWKATVADEQATTALIAGEAGVGKSRLLDEFVAGVSPPPLLLVGQCMEVVDRAMPFGPIVQVLRSLHRTLDPAALDAVVGPARGELGALLPELHASAPGNVVAGAVFEQLLAVLERLAEREPVLLLIEDLHWADRSTRELFVFLARSLRETPVMLVGTYRSDDLPRRHPLRVAVAELDRSGVVERIDVAPFDRDEVRELVSEICGEEPTAELVDRTFERSDGNAFFAEELLAARATSGPLPATLRDIVLARINLLSDDTQQVLRAGAVIGRFVDHRLLIAVAGLDDERLMAAVREAVEQQVFVADAGGLQYRFRHALVQEAVEDDLLPGDRVRLHTMVAELLETHPEWFDYGAGELPSEIACHWDAARNSTRALEAALTAARSAEAMYAYPEALLHVERVLALWADVGDAEARTEMRHVDVMRLAAHLAEMAGGPDRALDYIRAALDEVDPVADPVTAGLLHERWGRYAWMLSRTWEEILGHCDEAVRLVPAEPTVERARVVATLGQQLMLHGRHDDAIAACEEAITIAQAVGDKVIEGHARNSLGSVLAGIGRTDEGIAELHRARDLALETESWADVARAAVNESGALQSFGRHVEGLTLAMEGAELARAHGLDRSFGAFLRLNANESLWELGRWNEFEEQLHEVEAIGPVGIDEWRVAAQRCNLAVARGEFDAARRYAEQVADVITGSDRVKDHLAVERLRANIARWEGDLDTALRNALSAINDRSEGVTLCTDDGVEVILDGVGSGASLASRTTDERARAEYQAATAEIGASFERWVTDERWGGGRPADLALLVEHADAELARAHDTDESARWIALADRWAGYSMLPREAYTRWRASEAAVREGDRATAECEARRAYELAVTMGWIVVRDAIAQLARRARLDIDVPDDVAPSAAERFGLTARELDVLALVAEGRTNRQIAEALFISAKTASVHVSNILAKLGVANRGEAAAAARRLGLDPSSVNS
jgi:DNA-binding CsgD family transcriptional regulator